MNSWPISIGYGIIAGALVFGIIMIFRLMAWLDKNGY
jgi:hypothetical protein